MLVSSTILSIDHTLLKIFFKGLDKNFFFLNITDYINASWQIPCHIALGLTASCTHQLSFPSWSTRAIQKMPNS